MTTVCFIGLPSAGKSSIINSLIGKRYLKTGLQITTTEPAFIGKQNIYGMKNYHEYCPISDDGIIYNIFDLPGICDSSNGDMLLKDITRDVIEKSDITFWVSDINKAFLTANEVAEYKMIKDFIDNITIDTGKIHQLYVILSKCDAVVDKAGNEKANHETIGNEIADDGDDLFDMVTNVISMLGTTPILFNAYGRSLHHTDSSSQLKAFVKKRGLFTLANIDFVLGPYLEYAEKNKYNVLYKGFVKKYCKFLYNADIEKYSDDIISTIEGVRPVTNGSPYRSTGDVGESSRAVDESTGAVDESSSMDIEKMKCMLSEIKEQSQSKYETIIEYLLVPHTTDYGTAFDLMKSFATKTVLEKIAKDRLMYMLLLGADDFDENGLQYLFDIYKHFNCNIWMIRLYYIAKNKYGYTLSGYEEVTYGIEINDIGIQKKIASMRKSLYPYEQININTFVAVYAKDGVYANVYNIHCLLFLDNCTGGVRGKCRYTKTYDEFMCKINRILDIPYDIVQSKLWNDTKVLRVMSTVFLEQNKLYIAVCKMNARYGLKIGNKSHRLCKREEQRWRLNETIAELRWKLFDKLGNVLIHDPVIIRDMFMDLAEQYWCLLQYIPEEYIIEKELQNKINIRGHGLRYVPDKYKTEELCKTALGAGKKILRYIPNKYKTEELCKIAVNRNKDEIRFVPAKYRNSYGDC